MAFLSKAYKLYKLWIFRRTWKIKNRHNETVPRRIFPIDMVQVGNYSYGLLDVYTWGAPEEHLEIGSFVSIASGVKFLLGGNHRVDTLFTFPVRVKFGKEKQEATSKGPIVIEDDVWIGMDAIILSGSKIGRGSVIGAGAVVSGVIPPYSIAVGNPCRVVKKRFPLTVINKLIEVDLSSVPKSLLVDNISAFYETLDDRLLEKLLNILKQNESPSSHESERGGQKDGYV